MILAANRTLKVIGRIKTLKDSIITIKLIRTIGVPVGTRCLKFFSKLFIYPINKIENQKGRPKDKEYNKWEDQVKVYLNNPCKFLKRINIIKAKNKFKEPFW